MRDTLITASESVNTVRHIDAGSGQPLCGRAGEFRHVVPQRKALWDLCQRCTLYSETADL